MVRRGDADVMFAGGTEASMHEALVAGFAAGATIGSLFVAWELRRNEPMLDMRLFSNRSFSASSVALAMLFFAMSGTVFLQAQYLQFVLGYTPLVAGFALVPAALTAVAAALAGGAKPTRATWPMPSRRQRRTCRFASLGRREPATMRRWARS